MDLFSQDSNGNDGNAPTSPALHGETVEVLIPQPFNHGFDYRVPARMEGRVKRGDLVKINFGPRKAEAKYVLGVVLGPGKGEVSIEKCKPIAQVFHDVPPLSKELLKTLQWITEYTMSPIGAVLKMALPLADAVFDPPKYTKLAVLPNIDRTALTPKRQKIVDALEWQKNNAPPFASKVDLAKAAGVSTSIVSGMEKAGLLMASNEILAISHPLTKTAREASRSEQGKTQTQLSASQKEAAELLSSKLDKGFSVTLIDGVTGSGKTEVYFEVIEEMLKDSEAQSVASRRSPLGVNEESESKPFSRTAEINIKTRTNAQALVLLPEIALSHQWLKRCEARFGFAPVVWHSGLTKRQRAIALRSIMTGSARLIVGARSALLLPYKNLGLIIVDEEHDGSYKQEEGVIYHARDMAVARAHQEQIPLQLASATPSIETVVNVQRGRYGRVVLESRYGGAQLPNIDMIDMRSEPLERGRWISPKLREALLGTLSKGHQSLLFLNRRGYAPLVLCRSCGTRAECPNCSTWMVLHAANRPYLQCHHCDTRLPVPKNCHSCGETDGLTPCGPGVERIAEEITQTVPQARIGILSSDHAEQGESLQELLAKVENREIDIIIGTQIIAKGHHFPYLATVGVVDADLGLSGGDLRASERSYQLLHQLAGRAGREHTGGQVYLQSYMPEHPVMQALAAGNRDGLLALEMQRREAMQMPPYGRLAAIILEGKNETEVRGYANHLAAHAPHLDGITILGPAPAPLLKLRRYFRYRFLIQAPLNTHLQKLLDSWLTPHKPPRGMKRKIDIDPYSFL